LNYIRTSAITLASSPSVTGWATWLPPMGVVAAECITDCSDPLDAAWRQSASGTRLPGSAGSGMTAFARLHGDFPVDHEHDVLLVAGPRPAVARLAPVATAIA